MDIDIDTSARSADDPLFRRATDLAYYAGALAETVRLLLTRGPTPVVAKHAAELLARYDEGLPYQHGPAASRSPDRTPSEPRTYRIEATKRRDGQHVAGTTRWDGLSDVYAVTTDDGLTVYVSSLDDITLFEEMPR